MQRNILKHLQKLFTTNYDKTIWLLIPPRRISTKPGEASLKSAGPPSILPDQQKKRVAYENSRPASSTGVLPTNVHLQERPTVHRTASMANLEKKKTRWHQERPADPNQPTNQNDFGLKGFGLCLNFWDPKKGNWIGPLFRDRYIYLAKSQKSASQDGQWGGNLSLKISMLWRRLQDFLGSWSAETSRQGKPCCVEAVPWRCLFFGGGLGS